MPSADAPFAEALTGQTGRAGGQILWDPGPCTIPPGRLAGSGHWATGRLRLHKVLIVEPGTALDCHLAHCAALRPLGSP